MTSTLRTTIEATARSFIASYEDGASQNEPSLINRAVAPECTRHLLPASLLAALGAPEDYAIDNAEYQRLFTNDLLVGGVRRSVLSNLVIDVEARRAAVTTVSDMVFHDGETLVMEFSWIFHLNDDGSKVTRVVEFCDTSAVLKLVAKVSSGQDDGKSLETRTREDA